MGIYVYFDMVNVKKDEWDNAYKQTLKVLDSRLNDYLDNYDYSYKGSTMKCVVKTAERDLYNNKKGWTTFGCCSNFEMCETFELYANIEDYKLKAYDENITDVFQCNDFNANDDDTSENKVSSRTIWGAKTQGGKYHENIFLMGCILEQFLGDKGFLYGDLRKDDFEAISINAKKFLNIDLELPAALNHEKLFKRLVKIEPDKKKCVENFFYNYKSILASYVKVMIDDEFGEDILIKYYQDKLKRFKPDMRGFTQIIEEMVRLGFTFTGIFSSIDFDYYKEDLEEEDLEEDVDYKKGFVKAVVKNNMLLFPNDEDDAYVSGNVEAQFFDVLFGLSRYNQKTPSEVEYNNVINDLKNCFPDYVPYIDELLTQTSHIKNNPKTLKTLHFRK